MERATAQAAVGQIAEPTFDVGMLMGGVVVHDQVQVEFAGCLLVDALQGAEELLAPVLRHAIPDDGTVQRRKGREQRRGAVALLVVGHRPAAARFHGQVRLGPVQRLNLALFIHAQHQRLIGRSPTTPVVDGLARFGAVLTSRSGSFPVRFFAIVYFQ